jgi:hypothetical protein
MCARVVQRVWQGHLGRCRARLMKQIAREAMEEALMTVEEVLALKIRLIDTSALHIQRVWRGCVGRCIASHLKSLDNAARCIQRFSRLSKSHVIVLALRAARRQRHDAAKVIQAAWLGSRGRLLVHILRDEARVRLGGMHIKCSLLRDTYSTNLVCIVCCEHHRHGFAHCSLTAVFRPTLALAQGTGEAADE